MQAECARVSLMVNLFIIIPVLPMPSPYAVWKLSFREDTVLRALNLQWVKS
jgi:hypothetical protein